MVPLSCLGAILSTSVICLGLFPSLSGASIFNNPISQREPPNPIVFANESSPPCPLPVWYARDLSWHNSSHHLDCSPALHSYNNSVPAPPINRLCFTGLSRQPEGYG